MRIAFIARRNMMRYPYVSLQNIISVAIPVFIVSLLFSLISGMEQDMKNIIIRYLAGDIRIRNSDYEKNEVFNPSYFLVTEASETVDILQDVEGVQGVRSKLIVPVAMFIDGDMEPQQLTGLSFPTERKLYDLDSFIQEGRIPQQGKKEVLVGSTNAELLDIALGDVITFIGSTALRGSNGMSAKVVGIVKYPVTTFNTRTLYMPLDVVQDFFRSPNEITEMSVIRDSSSKISSSDFYTRVTQKISQLERDEDLDIVTWDKISSLYSAIQLGRIIYFVLGAFFCFLGALVVYNSIYIALYNRRYELGILNANGFSRTMLQRMIRYEVLYTVIIGSGVGMAISLALITWLHTVGLNLEIFGKQVDSGALMTNIIYPQLSVFWGTVLVLYSTVVCYMIGILPTFSLKKETPLSLLRST